jgi:PKD repeat protein
LYGVDLLEITSASKKLNIWLIFAVQNPSKFSLNIKSPMKKILSVLALAAIFTSCKKENNPPKPTAGFSFARNTSADAITIGASDTASVISNATNAASISWDLGDGRTVAEYTVVLSYPKAGTYTVTLNAKAADGTIATSTKKVTVQDRVLKNIVINEVYWNNTDAMYKDAGWPLTETADIYVKIQQLQGNEVYLPNGVVQNAPVIYTSPIIANVAKNTTAPLQINVSGKVVLNKTLLDNYKYVISLVAKNASGEYVLFNNHYSGSEQMTKADDITKNQFVVKTDFFSSMTLNAEFE